MKKAMTLSLIIALLSAFFIGAEFTLLVLDLSDMNFKEAVSCFILILVLGLSLYVNVKDVYRDATKPRVIECPNEPRVTRDPADSTADWMVKFDWEEVKEDEQCLENL